MMTVKYRYTRPQQATSGVASRNEISMLACGQNIGVKAITSVMPTGMRTAENTRLKASNALSSRTRPVAFLTNRLRLPPGGCAPLRLSVVVTLIPPSDVYAARPGWVARSAQVGPSCVP